MKSTTSITCSRLLHALSTTGSRSRAATLLASRSVSHLAAASQLSVPSPFRQPLWKKQQQKQIRSIFVQSLETPNPESLKFVPTGIIVLADGDINGFYVSKSDPKETILRSPLAKLLFQIDGVKAVYLGADFVTVTKVVRVEWKSLRPQILDVLMNFFDEKDAVALRDQPEIIDTTILDDDDEIVAMIKELIESRIRPAGKPRRFFGVLLFQASRGLIIYPYPFLPCE
jgi:NFU1 iron-sulfur cluster scaffold homolog, mitochondrial